MSALRTSFWVLHNAFGSTLELVSGIGVRSTIAIMAAGFLNEQTKSQYNREYVIRYLQVTIHIAETDEHNYY